MGNEVKEFFDRLAPSWDGRSTDNPFMIRFLLHRVGIRPGSEVLDLACGTGIITGTLAEVYNCHVLGYDISEKMIEIARKKYEDVNNIEFEVGDFLESSFSERFDYILCHNAFPHFLDVPKFVDRLYSSLKPGGEFAVFHSLGRKALEKHHDNLGPNISRDLGPVKEEAKAFEGKFEILDAAEGDNFFFILGRK